MVVEGGYHVLPVVVVGGHQHYALPLLVIAIYNLAIYETIAFHDAAGIGIEIVNALNNQVADVVVVGAFNLFPFGIAHFGIGVGKIIFGYRPPIANHMVRQHIQYIRQQLT